MRVFYFARVDGAGEEAGARHVFEFCRHFAALGHAVTLFLPDLGKRRALEGVSLVYVPVLIRRPAFTFFSFYFILFFFFIYNYIKSRPDVVYTRYQQMEWMVTWLRFLMPFTYVIEANGVTAFDLKISSTPRWIITATCWMEMFVFRWSHRMVTPSFRARDILCRSYGLEESRFLVVNNGADPETFRPMDKIRCRYMLKIPPERKYLVFVGSFKKWHGIEEIIKTLPGLVEKVPDIGLLLVGMGESQEEIERYILDEGLDRYVFLLGKRSLDEVPVCINAADIGLAPYFDPRINETGFSPIKIFEYMACGLPVIASSIAGIETLFQSDEIGVLVHSGDPKDLLEAVQKLMHDPARMKRYGENGRAAVVRQYNWAAVCETISRGIGR